MLMLGQKADKAVAVVEIDGAVWTDLGVFGFTQVYLSLGLGPPVEPPVAPRLLAASSCR